MVLYKHIHHHHLSVLCCSHCMASNPSITQYPPGVQLPHEPGPSTGELPPGEGCYNCNHDFGDLPLSRPYRGRSRRSVAERMEVEEDDLEEVLSVYRHRLVAEEAMSVGEVVRSRRSVDPYYEWHVSRVSWTASVSMWCGVRVCFCMSAFSPHLFKLDCLCVYVRERVFFAYPCECIPSSLISANWTFSLCRGFFPSLLSLQAGLTDLCIWLLHPLLLQAIMLKVPDFSSKT